MLPRAERHLSLRQTDALQWICGINGDGANEVRDGVTIMMIISNDDLLLVARPLRRERLELEAVDIWLKIPLLHRSEYAFSSLASCGVSPVPLYGVLFLLRVLVCCGVVGVESMSPSWR